MYVHIIVFIGEAVMLYPEIVELDWVLFLPVIQVLQYIIYYIFTTSNILASYIVVYCVRM